MPVLVDPDSEESKERRKWEMFHTQYGPPGRPYEKIRTSIEGRFPAMLYKAFQTPANLDGAGKWATGAVRPPRYQFQTDDAWTHACEAADAFALQCQMVVHDEAEYKRAKAAGWSDTSLEAMELATREQKALGEGAAIRAYEDRNMSESAKAEAKEFEEENFGHQPEIKEKPKRRGRPRKEAAA